MSGTKSGPIRFVGGSKHNQIMSVRFIRVIRIPIPDHALVFKSPFGMDLREAIIEEYELTEMRLGTGCSFFEYHVADRLARDGYRECELSGANGSMHPEY